MRLELFNEVIIMFCHYHMLVFTNFNTAQFTHFYLGQTFVSLIFFLMAVNLAIMIFSSVDKFKRQRLLKGVIKLRMKEKMVKILS